MVSCSHNSHEPYPRFYPVWAIDYLSGWPMVFGAVVALTRRLHEAGAAPRFVSPEGRRWCRPSPPGARPSDRSLSYETSQRRESESPIRGR